MQTKQINQSTEELKDLAMKSTPHKSPSHSSSLFERSNKKEEEEEEELEMRAIPKDGQNFDFEEELNFKIISNSNSRDKNGLKSPESASQHSNNSLSLKNPESQNDIDSHKQSVLAILEKIKDQAGLLELFEKYQPKNKEISVVELKASPRTKLKKYKDCIYFGEIINSNRQGKGIMIYADTRVYEGFWENNLKHGKGLEILAQGNRYEGQFLNGKPEGVGTFIWTNGEIYEGEWKNGLKHGSGMWKGIRGESYVGEWKSGKVDGYGIHIWRNGDRYEGELKGFLKHGQGTEKFVNGDFYVGNYVNGKPDGYGEYYWSNGCQYKGHFKNGLRHGKGIWKKAAENSDIYDGEWINDKKCGEGTYVWASGNTYKGEYFNDMRHGYGDMFWSDGSCYKGAWEKGIQHGEGELSVPNKPIQKGLFSNNVFVGEVNGDLKLNSFETVDKKANNESLPHISGGINHPSRNELPEIKNSRGRAAERSHSQASGKRIANAGGSLEKSFQNNKESSAPRRRTLALSTSKEKYTGEFKKLKELNNLDISTQVRKKAPLPVWKPAGKPTVQTRKEKSYYV